MSGQVIRCIRDLVPVSPALNATVRSVGRRQFFLDQINTTGWDLLPSSLVLTTSDGCVGHWCKPQPATAGLGESLTLFFRSVVCYVCGTWHFAALKYGVRCWEGLRSPWKTQ